MKKVEGNRFFFQISTQKPSKLIAKKSLVQKKLIYLVQRKNEFNYTKILKNENTKKC